MPVILNFARCPFCKTSNYAVEYRGVRTKEEKGLEQIVRIMFLGSIVAGSISILHLGINLYISHMYRRSNA